MAGTHWLLLIPYYLFGALGALLLLILCCRILRLRFSLNVLATTAVLVAVAGVVIPPLTDLLSLASYTTARMLALIAATGVLALLDALLATRLPLPLDNELRQL